MNPFKKYYRNTTYFVCPYCKEEFELTFWQWVFTIMKIDPIRYRYISCPHCKAYGWFKAQKREK